MDAALKEKRVEPTETGIIQEDGFEGKVAVPKVGWVNIPNALFSCQELCQVNKDLDQTRNCENWLHNLDCESRMYSKHNLDHQIF